MSHIETYKSLHFSVGTTRHKVVPFLWKSSCNCGHYVLAATEERARLGLDQHILSEEPFPDLRLDHEEKEA